MTEAAYKELEKIFYSIPEWIKKKQIRDLGLFAFLHYRFFVRIMSVRVFFTERRLRILKRNLDIQQRAYVIMSCKILFTENFF
jgi:hypothetical protein